MPQDMRNQHDMDISGIVVVHASFSGEKVDYEKIKERFVANSWEKIVPHADINGKCLSTTWKKNRATKSEAVKVLEAAELAGGCENMTYVIHRSDTQPLVSSPI